MTGDKKRLDKYSTKDLTEELMKREGVKSRRLDLEDTVNIGIDWSEGLSEYISRG